MNHSGFHAFLCYWGDVENSLHRLLQWRCGEKRTSVLKMHDKYLYIAAYLCNWHVMLTHIR